MTDFEAQEREDRIDGWILVIVGYVAYAALFALAGYLLYLTY